MPLIKCEECGKGIIVKSKNLKFFIGIVVGIVLSLIVMFCLYWFFTTKKVKENNGKCLNTFSYNERSNVCIQRNMTMPNDDNSCKEDYIYDSYDKRCYKYVITPPLIYDEDIEKANEYIKQQ